MNAYLVVLGTLAFAAQVARLAVALADYKRRWRASDELAASQVARASRGAL